MKSPPQINGKRAVSEKAPALKTKSKSSHFKTDHIYKKQEDRVEHIRKVIKKRIANKSQENSFYVFDIASVKERVEMWRYYLPRVELFYATKCNTDHQIVQECVKLGCGFDVASEAEMKLVMNFGAKSDNLIFANPVKSKS